LRDEVLREWRQPARAEGEGAQAEGGVLDEKPSLVETDPMAEPFWTLAMSLAWIIWRTPEKTREYSERESFHPSDVLAHAIKNADGADQIVMPNVAVEALWKGLRGGELIASGRLSKYHGERPSNSLNLVDIPAKEWSALSLRELPVYGPDSVCSDIKQQQQLPRYHEVHVERDKVLALWRKVPPGLIEPAKIKVRLPRKTRAAAEWLRSNYEKRPPNSVDELIRLAKGVVDCSKRTFEKALKEAWPDS
jgi:hypothetical protein